MMFVPLYSYRDSFLLEDKVYLRPMVTCPFFFKIIRSNTIVYLAQSVLALKEFSRVLKPGAQWIVNATHLTQRHQLPNEHCCYTQEGLSNLVGEAGFAANRVTAYGELLSFLKHQSSFFVPGAFLGGPLIADAAPGLIPPLSRIMNTLGWRIDRGALLPPGILRVAEKPYDSDG